MEIQRRAARRTTRDEPRERLLDSLIRSQEWLDPVAEWLQGVIGALYGGLGRPGTALKNLLHGTTVLGHPLHPALIAVPLGAWTVGAIADWAAIASGRISMQTGDLALIVGLLVALAAALSGYTDFHETYGHERRTAVTHGLTMTAVIAVFALSLALRWWGGPGAHVLAVVLSTLAYIGAQAGAYIGGHLAFGLGTMVNRNAFVEGPAEFVAVGSPADFPEGVMRRVDAGGMPALLVRRQGELCAIGAVCSHAGGPLDEGELNGDTVTCPWHGSRFSVCSGRVEGGPATFDQPGFLVREQDGKVEVRLAQPQH
ncbi:MAG TPA: Rieske 2Fe-2S domain-containing protein [Candidatus Dormibacteraeota bacterium]